MPSVTKPVPIGIKNTNLSAGEYVKVTNLTSGGTVMAVVNSSKEAIFYPANSGLQWGNEDTILIQSTGRIPFLVSGTIDKGGFNATSTDSTADTATQNVQM